jgi:hypothetical protein
MNSLVGLVTTWGIAIAPSSFGVFGGDLLVRNFSSAANEINAFDPVRHEAAASEAEKWLCRR